MNGRWMIALQWLLALQLTASTQPAATDVLRATKRSLDGAESAVYVVSRA
jgi:hypothetical protein